MSPYSEGVTESRTLLHNFTIAAIVAHDVNERFGEKRPKHGPRGVTRRAHKRRRRVLMRHLQRVSWCSYFEGQKA